MQRCQPNQRRRRHPELTAPANYRFYVNTITKKSQWEKPTAPAKGLDDVPDGPPPGYTPGSGPAPTDSKKTNPFDTKTTNATPGAGSSSQLDEDERLARQMQEEEDAQPQP